MPQVDLIDETFLVADPAAVAAAFHDRAMTGALWPDLELTVFEDRGPNGVRWTATGGLVGSAEVWLQPWGDGVIAHVYLRCDITRRGSSTEPVGGSGLRLRRRADRERRRRAWALKAAMVSLRRELEAGRAAGEPRQRPTPGPETGLETGLETGPKTGLETGPERGLKP